MTGCSRCAVTVDDAGRAHHASTCPELRWPDGRPRGVPEGVAPLRPFDASKQHRDPVRARLGWRDPRYMDNAGGLSPLSIELAGIFAGRR